MVQYHSFRDFSCSRQALTPLQALLGYGFVWFGVFVLYFLVKAFSPAVDHIAWLAAFTLNDPAFFVFGLAYQAYYLTPFLAIGSAIAVSMLMILRIQQKTQPELGFQSSEKD